AAELPIDTLHCIFSLCAYVARDRRSQELVYDGSATLRSISQVCSLWRQVCNSDTSLWSQVIDFSPGQAGWKEVVSLRAGSRPTSTTVLLRPRHSDPVPAAYPPCKDLSYHVILPIADHNDEHRRLKSKIQRILADSLDQHKSSLSSFSIHFSKQFDQRPALTLDGKVFPLIHHLHLSGCTLDPVATFFPNLSTLDISFAPPSTLSQYFGAQLTRQLRELPRLRVLRLHEVSVLTNEGRRPGISNEAFVNVDLLHLSVLFLSGDLRIINALLESIKRPSTCAVCIVGDAERHFDPDTRLDLLNQIKAITTQWPSVQHVGWLVTNLYHSKTTISSLRQWPDPPFGSFTLTLDNGVMTDHFVPQLGSDAEVLRLDPSAALRVPWDALISSFSSIRTLVCPNMSIIEYLLERPAFSHTKFPLLQHIQLDDMARSSPDFIAALNGFRHARDEENSGPRLRTSFLGLDDHLEYFSGLNGLGDVLPSGAEAKQVPGFRHRFP
ncbi:hypothetical protein CVT26_000887, partial [Gymnopilus dilepis]